MQTGLEVDAPRGRIHLIRAMADNRIPITDKALDRLALCLDCRACESVCPSGVIYHQLIEETKRLLATHRKQSLVQKLINFIFFYIFPYPTRLKLVLLPTRILQKTRLWKPLIRLSSPFLPPQLQKMQQMLPQKGPLWENKLNKYYPPNSNNSDNNKPITIGFLSGCVGSVFYQSVHRQAIHLLQHFNCKVIVPPEQCCCGAIHHHGGKTEQAKKMAKQNIDAFANVNLIVTDIAGCGAMLKEYDHLLQDDPKYADKAALFVKRVRDISEVLVDVMPTTPPPYPVNLNITYHDACHLAHAQQVVSPPRQLLHAISNLTIVDLPESDTCCGAGGTYNLQQPQMAKQLAQRKLKNIASTGCDICVMGNVGCAMQIQSEADRVNMKLQILHPVQLLHQAYFGTD